MQVTITITGKPHEVAELARAVTGGPGSTVTQTADGLTLTVGGPMCAEQAANHAQESTEMA